jgi:hypothetical protein
MQNQLLQLFLKSAGLNEFKFRDNVVMTVQERSPQRFCATILSPIMKDCIDVLKHEAEIVHLRSIHFSIVANGWISTTNYAIYGWVPTRILMFWFTKKPEDITDDMLLHPQRQVTRFTTPFTTVNDYIGFLHFEEQPRTKTLIYCCDNFFTFEEGEQPISGLFPHKFDEQNNLIIYSLCFL